MAGRKHERMSFFGRSRAFVDVFSQPVAEIETDFIMATGCKSRAPKGPTTTHSPPVARRGLPSLQIPAYPDKAPLARGEDTLYRFPLLVFAGEARRSSPR